MGGPKGPMRGRKTHRFDIKLNRGEHKEPQPDHKTAASEEHESKHEERVREEHPTRMTVAGYRSTHGNRR